MDITLLIGMFFCHFLADGIELSNSRTITAKEIWTHLLSILDNALVHSVIMFVFLIFIGIDWNIVVIVTGIQLISHFLITLFIWKLNTWVSSVKNPTNKIHWVLMGLNRYLHTLIIILMYYLCIYYTQMVGIVGNSL